VTNTASVNVCPTISGYTLTGRNGLTCNYNVTKTETTNPETCPATYGDYKLSSQDGFTCKYSKTVKTPYQEKVVNKKTCYSQKEVVSCSGCAPVIQNIPYDCSTTSYVTKYKETTETTTTTVGCPTGYGNVNGVCSKTTTSTDTKATSCSSGYTYNSKNDNCVKVVTENKNGNANCSTGYTQNVNICSKTTISTSYEDVIKTCPVNYKETSDNTKCYTVVTETIKKTGTKDVTYYRYRVREYVGATVDYKWSKSNNDKDLINAGYKLTGRTR